EQAEAAYAVAKGLGVAVQVAVHLDVDSASLVERLVTRGHAEGRTDDTPEVIQHRIDVYEERTQPLLEYYRSRERLVTVNGDRPAGSWPPGCRSSPMDTSPTAGTGRSTPSSSTHSRTAAASGSSSSRCSPFGTDQAASSLRDQNGPPMCPSNTSSDGTRSAGS